MFSVAAEGVTLGAAGINYDEFAPMSGGFKFLSGGPFQGPDDVILDDYYADQTKAKVGDTITLLNSKWRVSGIMESGKLSHIVLPDRYPEGTERQPRKRQPDLHQARRPREYASHD